MLIQEMGLHVMLETSAAALTTTMGDYTEENPDAISNGGARIGAGGIAWSGLYADSGWTSTGSGFFGGLALTMNLSATVAGSEGSNIDMTIVGSVPLRLGAGRLHQGGFACRRRQLQRPCGGWSGRSELYRQPGQAGRPWVRAPSAGPRSRLI